MITDMMGTELTLAMNQALPYLFWLNTTKKLIGFDANLLYTLSKHLNFTFNTIDCNYNWGTKLPNGSWEGIVGKVNDGTADIGLGFVSLTLERAQVVDYSQPYMFDQATFAIPKTGQYYRSVSLLMPFDHKIWICFLTSLLLLITICFISEKHSNLNNLNIVWIFIQIMFQKSAKMSQILSGLHNFTLIIWTFACFILISFYGGGLHSYMSSLRDHKSINTIYDLVKAQKQGRIQVFIPKGIEYHSAIMNSDIDIYQDMSRLLRTVKNSGQLYELMIKSTSKKYAYIFGRIPLNYAVKYYGLPYTIPKFHHKDSSLFYDFIVMVFRKDFLFKKHFNQIISRLKESGLLTHWIKDFFAKSLHPDSRETINWKALTLNQLDNAFYIYLLGCFLTFLFCIFEHCMMIHE